MTESNAPCDGGGDESPTGRAEVTASAAMDMRETSRDVSDAARSDSLRASDTDQETTKDAMDTSGDVERSTQSTYSYEDVGPGWPDDRDDESTVELSGSYEDLGDVEAAVCGNGEREEPARLIIATRPRRA